MLRILVALLIGLGLVGGIFFLNRTRSGESGHSLLHVATADALTVNVAHPQTQTIIRTVQAPGQVEAVREVEISAEIPAKIVEMPVEEGQSVRAGDLLCRLNDDEFRALVESGEASVAKLQAYIEQAQADLAKCERDFERIRGLAEFDATNAVELADYRTSLIKARASVDIRRQELVEAEALLRRARENLAKTNITAPISGVISALHAKQGEVVVTGTMNNPGTVIMVITDLSQMQVRARVDETDVPLVKPDQPARIFLPSDPQKPVPGRVLRVATNGTKPLGRDVVTFETLILVEEPMAASSRGHATQPADADVALPDPRGTEDSAGEPVVPAATTANEPPRAKPAMTANVEIEVARRENTLTIPVQAVVHRKRKDLPDALVKAFDESAGDAAPGPSRAAKAQYLPVIYSMVGGKAAPHVVRTGIADATHVELLDGVTAEEQVIIGPYRSLDRLKDGTTVKLDEKDKPAEKPSGKTQVAETEKSARVADKG